MEEHLPKSKLHFASGLRCFQSLTTKQAGFIQRWQKNNPFSQDPPAHVQQSYTRLQFPLVTQQLSHRHHLLVGSLKLWVTNKAKVIADFLMHPCWAESSTMSSCLWIWCHLHPSRWPVNYHVVLLLKWSRQGLKHLERWWRWLYNPGRITLIFLWIEDFKRQAHETLSWYFIRVGCLKSHVRPKACTCSITFQVSLTSVQALQGACAELIMITGSQARCSGDAEIGTKFTQHSTWSAAKSN